MTDVSGGQYCVSASGAHALGLPSRAIARALSQWLAGRSPDSLLAGGLLGLVVETVEPCTQTDSAADAESVAMDGPDISAAIGGDGEAFARLIGRYQQQVATRMRWFNRQPGVCEELVQDVFVEVYLSLRSFRGRAPFSHWVQKIATRVGYRHWKYQARERRRGTARLDDHLDGLRAATAGDAVAAAETVHSLLSKLGPRDRLVLTLLYLEGNSVAEAAALAEWSQTMIKVQAFRARRKLQRLLAKIEEQPATSG